VTSTGAIYDERRRAKIVDFTYVAESGGKRLSNGFNFA
jgi:hypothetical protein